uniref:arylamine N-acetyltransferase n=2 Tax=Gouania willdenowi TaxID=441366 RepID=A0A8C5GED8_GOUWI
MLTGPYLSRIGFEGVSEPSLEVLRRIHTCHLMSVPFENLTAHSGGRVELELPLIYDKVVKRRRGGFCYEVNSLLSWLLSQLGFHVTLLSAQVKSAITGCYGPPFDHLVLLLSLEGNQWLCDVGFGARGLLSPLLLDSEEPQNQGHRWYRIRRTTEFHFLEERGQGPDGDWVEMYKFTLEPRCLGDFTEMCQYHQSSPYSLFFCKSLCTVLKPGGQIIYVGHKLITRTFPSEPNGLEESTSRDLEDQELTVILAEKFGIVLSAPLIIKDETVPPPPLTY